MTTASTTTLFIIVPIGSGFLDVLRGRGSDEFGNPLLPSDATGGEPLRCCLRRAAEGESIALISYSPHPRPSPWAEVGPVFVHAASCIRPASRDALPDGLRGGGRVVRACRADDSMKPQCFLYGVRRG